MLDVSNMLCTRARKGYGSARATPVVSGLEASPKFEHWDASQQLLESGQLLPVRESSSSVFWC